MPPVKPRILRGFRDHLPEDMLPRAHMFGVLERVFRAYGFLPLMTPALEYSEVLLGKYGDEGDSLLYRFDDNGGRDVALRYDLTVPLARVVAQYPELQLPFRRYQIAPVWRAEKPARGRFREFTQCDGDIVGSPDLVADAEVIQMGADMLRSLGVHSFRIRLNNRKVLRGLMETVDVEPGAAELAVLRTIDKLPKIGEEDTRRLLENENGLDTKRVERIFDFLTIAGGTTEILDRLDGFFAEVGAGQSGAAELREVLGLLEAAGLGELATVDLSIARGLNYYTGTIYETFLEDLPGFGAVMSGGRYDGLIGTFTRESVPAVGISLGIDRLVAGLRELDLVPAGESTAVVLVTVFDRASLPHAIGIARRIRDEGTPCELYPQVAKLRKQLRYAERSGKRFVVIAGPDEVASGAVQLKDLASRTQDEVALAEIGALLKQRLAN